MHRLNNVVALTCTKFVEKGIMKDMCPKAKVIQLREIAEDLRKKVVELESQIKRGIPQR